MLKRVSAESQIGFRTAHFAALWQGSMPDGFCSAQRHQVTALGIAVVAHQQEGSSGFSEPSWLLWKTALSAIQKKILELS